MLTSRSEPKNFKSFRASSYWLYLHSVNEKREGGKGGGKQLNKEMDHSWSLLNWIWNGQNQRRRRAYLRETKEQNEGRRRRRESAPLSRGSSLHTRSKTLLWTPLSLSLSLSLSLVLSPSLSFPRRHFVGWSLLKGLGLARLMDELCCC
jgi:hypothetical protein